MAQSLIEEIATGRLSPGSALPSEAALATRVGASKVVIREAIGILTNLRLVKVRHGARTVVRPESDWDLLAPLLQAALSAAGQGAQLVRQLYEARMLIEPEAAAFAARRISHDAAARFNDLVVAMAVAAEPPPDTAGFLQLDRAFHVAIADAVGNFAVRALLRDVLALADPNWTGSHVSKEDLQTLTSQHRKVAEAIVRRQPALARKAMREHLVWAAARETDLPSVGVVSRD